MKRLLKSLTFADGEKPSQADQARITNEIADLLQRAQRIGHEHASDKAQEGISWGGAFTDMWQSARDIVSNFVQRVADWITGQDEEDLTDADIQAEVDSLAETVGDTEIASAIESAVMDELNAQGFMQVAWIAMPGACALCMENAAASPIPIGTPFPSGDNYPPAHPHCRCSLGAPSEA